MAWSTFPLLVAQQSCMGGMAMGNAKGIGSHEPPFYVRPVGETEAAMLLQVKDYAGANGAYEAALVERPGSGFGLYGLARVRELSGDAEGARSSYQAFLKAWPAADANLPEVTHAREALATQAAAVHRESAGLQGEKR